MRTTGLLALLLIASPLAAQTSLPSEAIDARRYTVEIIIFAYSQAVSPGSEIFVADIPQYENELLSEPAEENSADEPDEKPLMPRREIAIEPLDRSDFSLDEIYGHLRRIDAYRPLAHFGWTQSTIAGEPTEPRSLASFIRLPAGLDGELNLYLNRYLHLDVNLRLAASPNQQPEPRRAAGFAENYPIYYRISEDRIFKNGDLRYFDHPKFGVLAKITRQEESDNNTELLGLESQ